MFVRVSEDVVYLARGEKIELAQFFVGSVIEVNRRVMKRVEVCLQLFVVHGSDFCDGIVDVQYDFV